jgi:hypothetical protein
MVWYVRYACPYPPQPLTWLWGGRGGGNCEKWVGDYWARKRFTEHKSPQPRSAAERLCVKEPVLAHWAKQKYEINYWHQYSIDAVQSYTFLRRPTENWKNILCNIVKTSLLLRSMDGIWPKLVLTTHEQEWRDIVSGLRGSPERAER